MHRLAKKNINQPTNKFFGSYSNFDYKRWRLMLKKYHGTRLCDIGCFDSKLIQLAQNTYPHAEIYGIDHNYRLIEILSQKDHRPTYLTRDCYDTKFQNNFFEYITAGELLEHLEYPELFIKEAMRILKPGGWFVSSVPYKETEAGEVDKEQHLWSFDKNDIRKLLKPYGSVKIKIIKRAFPDFKYHHPIMIAWCRKEYEYVKSNKNLLLRSFNLGIRI